MIIIGDNLRGLAIANKMCEESDISEHSLVINLGRTVYTPRKDQKTIKYGRQNSDHLFHKSEILNGELLLQRQSALLVSSAKPINMPIGYMGFIQTKGTLARFLVSAHASSSHIDTGFCGYLTLELINNSPFDIEIGVGSPIAQIYVVRCSTDNTNGYSGKYSEAKEPMPPLPFLG